MKNKPISTIGKQGQAWDEADKQAWYQTCEIKRSYLPVVEEMRTLTLNSVVGKFELIQYGALSLNESKYPLFAFKSCEWQPHKPTILITGGVHGYETSGVHGALGFMQNKATDYLGQFNIVVAPCISPWGYETINRWNPNTVDPNRSFYANSPSEEAAFLMAFIATLEQPVWAHIDLHETTDTDELEFRPALAARDGNPYVAGTIPDGFYLVGDSESPQPEFQQAIIKSVAQVTHIAPADEAGKIIGVALSQHGVINYPTKALGLCAGMTNSEYCTTTEVYPDSPKVNDQDCNHAQIAAITGALDFLSSKII